MPVPRYCTVAALTAALTLALTWVTTTAQQASATPAAGEATFVVFFGGREVGREQVAVARTAAGWTITSTSRLGPPLNFTNNRFEITYAPDWQPLALRLDARIQDRSFGLSTSFGTTTAANEITQNAITTTKTDQITARTVVLPNNFYGAYEALAARLAELAPGAELPVYVAPQAEIRLRVVAVTPTTYETPSGVVETRSYAVIFENPGRPLNAEITIDARNRLAKVEVDSGLLTATRQDLAGVATRERTFRNPTDTDVRIPAAGFSLAGSLTTPSVQERRRHPAIVLIGGSGPVDRDEIVAGIPLFAQLAGQLAELGYVVVRYDKRGTGQSGGRIETVTLRDYADDAIAAAKWVAGRKNVDRDRVFVAGHSEGAAVAMLAAREKRIAALVLMAGTGTTGKELILEQQRHALDATKVPEPERAEKIRLQTQILDTVIAQKGWEDLPPSLQPLVDTPWYRSLVMFDPEDTMKDVKQPVLVLHGALDRQVPPHHAERLAELARARRRAAPVEAKVFPSLNHLFVPARTGEVSEYASLETKVISPDVARTIDEWLKGLPAR